MKHNFRNLLIWKRSIEFVPQIYLLTSKFPDNEKFGLSSQLNRASISIPSNIAEGMSRTSNKELIRFIDISLGSSYEIETQLIITEKIYPNLKCECEVLSCEMREIQKMIGAFKAKIKDKMI